MTSRKRRSDTVVVNSSSSNQVPFASSNMKNDASTAEGATTNRRLKVRIQRFHGVAHWSWNANDDVCGICQFAFEGTAPGVKYPGEDCPVVWGKCAHAFHLQCVSKWLTQATSKNSCPICRQEWEFGQNPVNSNSNNAASSTNSNSSTGSS
jgi:anaphase-promoting complex subunit 11